MSKTLTRRQLHELVWDRPMTKLSKEFGLSDVALHKICRKFRVPTPPPGHWAKKAHGKRVTMTKLPDPDDEAEIVIRESTASNEPAPIAEARVAMAATLERAVCDDEHDNPVVERTLTKLSKRPDADGLVRCESDGLVRVSVCPESVTRASKVLRDAVGAGERAGLKLVKSDGAATWLCDGETIAFELVEVPDQVEHVATQKELDAVAKWKREREEKHRRYGYWDDWGEPKIPKWEQRHQGRLAIRLEKVRIQTDQSPWGDTIMGTFADTRTRDVTKMIPRVLTTVAAIAAAKKSNREVEARRRAAREEAEKLWAAEERRRIRNQQAESLLEQLLKESENADRLRRLIEKMRTVSTRASKVIRFIEWSEERLRRIERGLSGAALEDRLAKAGLFEAEIP